MKKLNHVALCAFNLTLALSATLLPLKPTNVFAEDSTSPPTCEEGYEYVESVGKCYKKCQEGWERNPETNRCRKIQIDPEPDEAPPEETPPTEEPSDDLPSDSSVDLLPGSLSEPSTDLTINSPVSSSIVDTGCKEGYEYIESVGKCYKKCQDGYERNPETNRCRKASVESEYETEPSVTSTLTVTPQPAGTTSVATSQTAGTTQVAQAIDVPETKPTCKDGYEYVASANKCYKACTDGYERNPETNRCKKVATSDSDEAAEESKNASCKDGYEFVESANKCYKKCQDGYERNPETNRCKKAETSSSEKTSGSSSAKTKTNNGADYGVDVPETGGNYAFIAGGIIAALVAAGAGFAAYQYRLEIKEFIKKRFKKS